MSIRIYQKLSENEEDWICSKCKHATKKKKKLNISEASNKKMNTLEKTDEKSLKNIVRDLLSKFVAPIMKTIERDMENLRTSVQHVRLFQ